MPTVSNTSPLLNLAIIGRLSLLRQQFGQVWIPQAVVEELRLGSGLPGSQAIQEAIEEGWILVGNVKDLALVKALQRDLDYGEAEAITLALQMHADGILLDEREARRLAKSLGLKVTEVLGILLRAKHEGDLQGVRAAMEQLREEAGFWIDEALAAEILQDSGEA